jgi:integrase
MGKTATVNHQQAAGMKPISRINIRGNISAFFNFCIEREWIEQNPCTEIKIKAIENEVTILTIEQTEALMKAAAASRHADKMVPYFAVCLFAGLRPTEAMRLDWSRIRFEDGRIEILRDTTKTRRRRWAKIEANGLDWLRPYSKPSGLIVSGFSAMTWKRQFNSIRMAAGLIPNPEAEEQSPTDAPRVWDQDIMRHSFASYWLAVHKNAPALAEIMGNTVPIIRKHYENTVLEDVAARFWAIRP